MQFEFIFEESIFFTLSTHMSQRDQDTTPFLYLQKKPPILCFLYGPAINAIILLEVNEPRKTAEVEF